MMRYNVQALLILVNVVTCTSTTFYGTTTSAIFTCHCARGEACVSTRGVDSGHCPSGCDDETLLWAPWSGPGCQIGNVAYLKNATQYRHTDNRYPASKAVDGLTSRDKVDQQCSMAERPGRWGRAYWRVDLGTNHVVDTITILTVNNEYERTGRLQVYLSSGTDYSSSDLCSHTSGSNTKLYNCDDRIGRYATVSGTSLNSALWFTEIYVTGYQHFQCNYSYDDNFWFGPACLKNCHCDEQCDLITGMCGGSCKDGYIESDCQTPCDHGEWGQRCQSRCNCACNHVTGSCEGKICDAGFRGRNCNNLCEEGTWGRGNENECPSTCNCADDSEICNRFNGSCPRSRCAAYYTGTGCDYAVPRLGTSDAPVRVDGNGRNVTIRFTQWHPQYGGDGQQEDMSYSVQYEEQGLIGYHTVNNTYFAHDNNVETVELTIVFPSLNTRYALRVLPHESSLNFTGTGEPSQILDIYTECKNGWYGDGCQNTCGCANNVPCNKTTGYCPNGCSMRKIGSDCSIDLPSLAGKSIAPNLENNVISIDFDKLENTESYTVKYIIQYRLEGNENWDEMKQTKKRSIDLQINNILPNSYYEVRVLAEIFDIANKRYLIGESSNIAEVSSECSHEYNEQFPNSCTYWCECTDGFCFKQADYCNGECNNCVDLPNENNTGIIHSSTTDESIKVHLNYLKLKVLIYQIKVSKNTLEDTTLVQSLNVTNNMTTEIKGLSPATSYQIEVTAFLQSNFNELLSPPFIFKISTNNQSHMNIGFVIGIILMVVFLIAVGLLIGFLVVKYRKKHKKSKKKEGTNNDYYNVVRHKNGIAESIYTEVSMAKIDVTSTAPTCTDNDSGAISHNEKEIESVYNLVSKPTILPKKRNLYQSQKYQVVSFIAMKLKMDFLEKEYKKIPENEDAKTERGNMKENYEKHRFNNIKAYDHSRIVLDKTEGDEYSDYINACYVNGYQDREKLYVASQGPRKPTINDTWRMIWNIKANVIVMLTNLIEEQKVKCQRYWPKDNSLTYHDITVEIVETDVALFYTKRVLLAKRGDESRKIVHLQFTHWPDHGVPDTSYELLEFYHIVKSYHLDEDQPLLVHCSAGVGRTGTFIALDYLIQQAAQEKVVDVFGCVAHLRKYRCQMVQTASQYLFLHEALQTYLAFESQVIASNVYGKYFNQLNSTDYDSALKAMNKEVEGLDMTASDALNAENIDKNRDKRYVPTNTYRMYLTTPVPDTNNYIQAVMCDSYLQQNSLILTQIPLPTTVPDIWRLAYEQKADVIILLEEPDEKYWPEVADKMIHGPLEITLEKEDDTLYSDVIIRKIKIQHKKNEDSLIIKQWYLKQGSSALLSEETQSSWLSVYDQVQQYKKQQQANHVNRSPSIVQCMDGCSRSGLFAVLWSVLEKLGVESVVNVDFAIRRVRKHRPQAVLDAQQYQVLHHLVQHHLTDQQSGYYNL